MGCICNSVLSHAHGSPHTTPLPAFPRRESSGHLIISGPLLHPILFPPRAKGVNNNLNGQAFCSLDILQTPHIGAHASLLRHRHHLLLLLLKKTTCLIKHLIYFICFFEVADQETKHTWINYAWAKLEQSAATHQAGGIDGGAGRRRSKENGLEGLCVYPCVPLLTMNRSSKPH